MGNPVGQIPVVGHEKKSLGVIVKPSDRIDPRRNVRDQRHDRVPALVIRNRGHIANRLVQHDIHHFLFGSDQFSVKFDLVVVLINLDAHFGDHSAVHTDPALLDQGLCPAAGRNPAVCQKFLQSHHRSIKPFLYIGIEKAIWHFAPYGTIISYYLRDCNTNFEDT